MACARNMSSLLFLACLPLTFVSVNAHSWVEQLRVIKDGSYAGDPGYIRGYAPRGPGFSDFLNQNLLPPLASGRTRIDGSDPMCMATQTSANQTSGFPKLNASPGDFVALRYLENGHVTLPQNQQGKPGSGGTVMIYGTTQPKQNEKLTDVLKWNNKGTGGDKRGKLLTVQNFDDGRCYQINSSPTSQQRQQEFPNKPANAGTNAQSEELWCETNVKLPEDAATGQDLTLYWAWQWDTLPNMDPGLPDGKDEWYTSCMDVSMVSASEVGKASGPPPQTLQVQDPQPHANPNFKERAANVSLPDGGPDGGDSNPGDAASQPASSAPGAAPSPSPPFPAGSAPAGTSAVPSQGFGPSLSLLPIPNPTASPAAPQGPGFSGGFPGNGGPHTMTFTQVVTFTFKDKRGVQTTTTELADVAHVRRRNIWA